MHSNQAVDIQNVVLVCCTGAVAVIEKRSTKKRNRQRNKVHVIPLCFYGLGILGMLCRELGVVIGEAARAR